MPLCAYLAAIPGAVFLIAGYPQAGLPLMLLGPPAGAVLGFHWSSQPVEGLPAPEPPTWWAAVGVCMGSLLGETAYLIARLSAPYLLQEPPGTIGAVWSEAFRNTAWACGLLVPAASTLGALCAGRMVQREGSWLFSTAGGLAGSLLGWGASAISSTDNIVPSVLLAVVGSTLGYLVPARLERWAR